jgi:hypothetical protein
MILTGFMKKPHNGDDTPSTAIMSTTPFTFFDSCMKFYSNNRQLAGRKRLKPPLFVDLDPGTF